MSDYCKNEGRDETMTNDLLARLRLAVDPNAATPTGELWNLCDEAADEIERLRAELSSGSFYKESDIDRLMERAEKAEAENERLRAMIRVNMLHRCPGMTHEQIDLAIDAALAGK